jgi:hypothetical protein
LAQHERVLGPDSDDQGQRRGKAGEEWHTSTVGGIRALSQLKILQVH